MSDRGTKPASPARLRPRQSRAPLGLVLLRELLERRVASLTQALRLGDELLRDAAELLGLGIPLGPTHLAIEDIALMRAIPNMTVIVPADPDEIERAMIASVSHEGPIYIRVAKGGEKIVSRAEDGFRIGEAVVLRPLRDSGGDVLFIACGVLVDTALQAANALETEGIQAGVINVHTIKPLDETRLLENIQSARVVVTLEEHVKSGGLGSAVAELIAERATGTRRFKRLGLPDEFPSEYGSQASLLAAAGMDVAGVVRTAKELL